MPRSPKPKRPKQIASLTHEKARRRNIPTAEMQAFAEQMEENLPVAPVRYERARPLAEGETRDRDEDLDPQIVWNGARIRLSPDQVRQLQEKGEVEIGDAQLVWRGKDRQDWSDLVVQAPPLYIQEKVHPKAIIDDLVRHSKAAAEEKSDAPDLFADFNGIAPDAKAEFYQHDQNWSNRMILGDSLHVMASLATREGLKGKVQCIYIDPPYGIKFNSNWQVSTASRDVKDGKREDISREPEQVKAFRDTWEEEVHSYLTYLRDRLSVARELLSESGSIFVQIGDENVHLVRSLLDEVFGPKNFVSQIAFQTTTGFEAKYLGNMSDFILWYAKDHARGKARPPYYRKAFALGEGNARWLMFDDFTYRGVTASEQRGAEVVPDGARPYKPDNIISQGRAKAPQPFRYQGKEYDSWEKDSHWKASYPVGMERLAKAGRIHVAENSIQYVRYHTDFDVAVEGNIWTDTGGGNFLDEKIFVVQTNAKVVERCLLMTTDPGDLVLDPTCGSGTTAYVAEQWGRRWITIDTSRVALALARARIMGARYPYYLLADTPEGRLKEGEVTARSPSSAPTHGDIRQGFVYERAPHVTLKSIANNSEIDVIWEEYQAKLEPLRAELNKALAKSWEEWEIPREAGDDWSAAATKAHAAWWEARIARQKKIDDSIARNADVEFLYDRPYPDNSRVRVAGPFTVESLSPHRVVPADEEELSDALKASEGKRRRTKLVTPPTDFAEIILEHLRTAGVQQREKRDAIRFTALQGWPGEYIGAEGYFQEGDTQEAGSGSAATGNARERRAAISSGRSSAPSRGSISSPRRARPARRASTCSSPAPSTTTPTPPS